MKTCRKNVVGFYEEPSTYKHDFCSYPETWRSIEGTAQTHSSNDFRTRNQSPQHSKLPKSMTSYDTLQKLDYETRIPFDAMLEPKEIVGTNPRQSFCKRIIEDEGIKEAIKNRPRLYVSPAISLDNVENPDTRKLMVDFTYTTTTSQAGKEAWSGWCPRELCLPNTVFEKTVDPLALRLKLLPDIPAGFQASARKWDSIQERYYMDTTAEFSKNRNKIDYEKRLTNLVTTEEKNAVRTLIRKKLRLPYDKMPLSYGGFRPQFASEVPLEVKESSLYDPSLSVARAITARL